MLVTSLAALALVGLTATGASAVPPGLTVTCVVGGTTSFAHPLKGTDNATFVWSTLAGPVATGAWTGGSRRTPTPSIVTSDEFVVATFFNGTTELGQAEGSCT